MSGIGYSVLPFFSGIECSRRQVRVQSSGLGAITGFGCRVCNSPASPILADELHTRHPNPRTVPFSGIQTSAPCGILAPELKFHAFVVSPNSFRRSERGFGWGSHFVCEYRGSRRNGFPAWSRSLARSKYFCVAQRRSLARSRYVCVAQRRSLARSKYVCRKQSQQPAMLCIPQ